MYVKLESRPPKSQQPNTALVSKFLKVFQKKKHINMQMQKFNQTQRNPIIRAIKKLKTYTTEKTEKKKKKISKSHLDKRKYSEDTDLAA